MKLLQPSMTIPLSTSSSSTRLTLMPPVAFQSHHLDVGILIIWSVVTMAIFMWKQCKCARQLPTLVPLWIRFLFCPPRQRNVKTIRKFLTERKVGYFSVFPYRNSSCQQSGTLHTYLEEPLHRNHRQSFLYRSGISYFLLQSWHWIVSYLGIPILKSLPIMASRVLRSTSAHTPSYQLEPRYWSTSRQNHEAAGPVTECPVSISALQCSTIAHITYLWPLHPPLA